MTNLNSNSMAIELHRVSMCVCGTIFGIAFSIGVHSRAFWVYVKTTRTNRFIDAVAKLTKCFSVLLYTNVCVVVFLFSFTHALLSLSPHLFVSIRNLLLLLFHSVSPMDFHFKIYGLSIENGLTQRYRSNFYGNIFFQFVPFSCASVSVAFFFLLYCRFLINSPPISLWWV